MTLDELTFHKQIIEHATMPEGFRLSGWVYVLSNEFMPGIYKVGMTTISPEIRAKELSSATGVPAKFKIEESYYSTDPLGDEKLIHQHLADCRVNESREFFSGDLERILSVCNDITEFSTSAPVEEIADHYDIISTEKLGKLNIGDLFDSLGIQVFGCRLAAAERLIRIAHQFLIESNRKSSRSLFLQDGTAYVIRSQVDQMYEKYLEETNEKGRPAEPATEDTGVPF
ncbi:TPA: GIY-YIG nuclease family protein [Morganella morganii]|nr:GIY-YIG nuclease family protein [Morganella morganii]